MREVTRRIIVCTALVVGSSSPAWAQGAPAKPGFARKGFLIGFTLGGGTAACGTCDTKAAASASFHIGGMLTERLALMFDSGGVRFNEGRYEYAHVVGGLTAQYFVNQGLWLKAGLGQAQFSINRDLGPGRLGAFVAVGADLMQRGRFALDVSGRLAVGRHQGGTIRNTTAQLGVTWY